MPTIFHPELLDDRVLTSQLLRAYHTFGASCICCTEGLLYRDDLVTKWKADLKQVGGKLPPGKPNSPKLGLQRSNGLSYGTMAIAIRDNRQLRRCWQLLVVALGRCAPFKVDGDSKITEIKIKIQNLQLCTSPHHIRLI